MQLLRPPDRLVWPSLLAGIWLHPDRLLAGLPRNQVASVVVGTRAGMARTPELGSEVSMSFRFQSDSGVLAPPPMCCVLCRFARPLRARCTRRCSPTATLWAPTSWTRSWLCSAAPPGECGPLPFSRVQVMSTSVNGDSLPSCPCSLSPKPSKGNKRDEAPDPRWPWLLVLQGDRAAVRDSSHLLVRVAKAPVSPSHPRGLDRPHTGSRRGAFWGPRERFLKMK